MHNAEIIAILQDRTWGAQTQHCPTTQETSITSDGFIQNKYCKAVAGVQSMEA